MSTSLPPPQTTKTPVITSRQSRIRPYDKLIQVDSTKYALNLQQKQKQKVTEMKFSIYQTESKKKKKKRKLKLMEQEYERRRSQKIQMLENKTKNSTKVKQTVIKQKLQKQKTFNMLIKQIKSKSLKTLKDEHRSIKKKIILFNNIIKQKQFSINKQNPDTIHELISKNQSNQKNVDVELQMKKIQKKLQKAKHNQQLHKKQILTKLTQKQQHNLSIQQKIRSFSAMQEQKSYRQIYGKSQHIIQAGNKIKDLTARHLQNRRKQFQNKIQKLHQNIQSLESQQQQKYQELQEKFNKKYTFNPLSRSQTKQTHRQRVLFNNHKLEEEKKLKAEQILKKHADITAKNKIYKQKKDIILQTIKKANPEDNNL